MNTRIPVEGKRTYEDTQVRADRRADGSYVLITEKQGSGTDLVRTGLSLEEAYDLGETLPNRPNVAAPVAAFTFSPASPKQGEEVTFDASTSKGEGLTYQWSNIGGSDFGTGKVAKFTYKNTGTKEAKLVVTDSKGRKAEITNSLVVVSSTPTPTPDPGSRPRAPAAHRRWPSTSGAQQPDHGHHLQGQPEPDPGQDQGLHHQAGGPARRQRAGQRWPQHHLARDGHQRSIPEERTHDRLALRPPRASIRQFPGPSLHRRFLHGW